MATEAVQAERAAELLGLKQRNRKHLEAMAQQLEQLKEKRDRVAGEVDALRRDIELESQLKANPSDQGNSSDGGSSKALRWTSVGEDTTANSDGFSMTDEQVADALADLLDFSATKSNIRSSEK
jgi:hypothetical protein